MSEPTPAPVSSTAPAPIQSADEAAKVIAHLNDVMDSLLHILEEETELVRVGRVSEVARLEPLKAELARRYLAAAAAIKANGTYLARELPEQFDEMRRRHDTFHALLQINLTVLATAHAVSEGIIRGAADEIARKAAPQTYGASGRPSAPRATAVQPVTLYRTL